MLLEEGVTVSLFVHVRAIQKPLKLTNRVENALDPQRARQLAFVLDIMPATASASVTTVRSCTSAKMPGSSVSPSRTLTDR